MPVRIIVTYQDDESYRVYNADKILIGRPESADIPVLDLSPDTCVSRQHALLQIKDGACWISDLGSKFGTKVDGREIRSQGECQLGPENNVLIGETTLRFIVLGGPKAPSPAIPGKPAAAPGPGT